MRILVAFTILSLFGLFILESKSAEAIEKFKPIEVNRFGFIESPLRARIYGDNEALVNYLKKIDRNHILEFVDNNESVIELELAVFFVEKWTDFSLFHEQLEDPPLGQITKVIEKRFEEGNNAEVSFLNFYRDDTHKNQKLGIIVYNISNFTRTDIGVCVAENIMDILVGQKNYSKGDHQLICQ